MPPEGYSSITVSEETIEQITRVLLEYNCESLADAVKLASTIALEHDDAELAQILANKLSD